MLALFSVCVTWANYRREYYLRKNHLAEQLLLQRQERLEEEQERSATLLKSMLPPTVRAPRCRGAAAALLTPASCAQIMNDLLNGRSVISSEFSCVTVLFCELVNFSAISESRLPEVVVRLLPLLLRRAAAHTALTLPRAGHHPEPRLFCL